MLFWCRINQTKLKWQTLTRQFIRCYLQIPHAHSLNNTPYKIIQGFENPYWINSGKLSDFNYNVRFFASRAKAKHKHKHVHAKPKHAHAKPQPEQKVEPSGPRMNDQLTAEFVRLVTDDGHEIVPRMVALERARKLKFDLVEVQRNADPPVCKIMDFHQKKYKQKIKEKDRAKSKSEKTLRSGDCKLVRFSGKTEAKDLKMKADLVKRQMEHGYRVKCTAVGTEDQDLGELLTRLFSLIEDVAFVESGPKVEKTQAFVVVRHIKFGPTKKGSGKKVSEAVDITSSEDATLSPIISPTINPSSHVESPMELEEEFDPAETDVDSEDEVLSDEADAPISPSMKMTDITPDENQANWLFFDAKQTNAMLEPASSLESINISDFRRPILDSTRTNSVPSTPVEPTPGTLNRYRKNEPKNRFIPQTSMDNTGGGAANPMRSAPQSLNRGKQTPSHMNSLPSSSGETRQDRADASIFRNLKLPVDEIPKHEQSRPGPPSSSQPSYGSFSAPKAGTPGKLDPSANSSHPGPPSSQQPTFGAFSAPKPEAPGKLNPPASSSCPVPPSSPTSSFGIFSALTATSTGKQGMTSEVDKNKEGSPFESARNPSPRGVFNPNFPSKSDARQRSGTSQDGQGGWGIFSREDSKVIPSRTSDGEAKAQR